MLLRLARLLVRDSTRAADIARFAGAWRLIVARNPSCSVREPVGHPLCGFYAAAFTRPRRYSLRSHAEVMACRGPVAACGVAHRGANGDSAKGRHDVRGVAGPILVAFCSPQPGSATQPPRGIR